VVALVVTAAAIAAGVPAANGVATVVTAAAIAADAGTRNIQATTEEMVSHLLFLLSNSPERKSVPFQVVFLVVLAYTYINQTCFPVFNGRVTNSDQLLRSTMVTFLHLPTYLKGVFNHGKYHRH
jgi:hypothetical protein